jgi:predicted nucleic acid-binding protein
MPKGFFDTNVVLYAFSDDPRSTVAETLLSNGGDIASRFSMNSPMSRAANWGSIGRHWVRR